MSKYIESDTKLFLLKFSLIDEGYSCNEAIEKSGIELDYSQVMFKYHQYKMHGVEVLLPKNNNNSYSKAFKETIVQEYLTEGVSAIDLAIKYNISAYSTVRDWIKRYTLGKENISYSPLLGVYSMKARKTTFEERVEIVEACIESEKDYKKTALKYNVNYGQVYSWVKKYEKFGSAGLVDGRGQGKPTQTMTDEELVLAKTKALEERIKYLEMENKILKKLKEKERELINRRLDK